MAVECVQFETNVDDMDTRLWPIIIDRLLEAGADDAWVSPILMKKGRPAFKLGVLCGSEFAQQVRDTIFSETTSIGLREFSVTKHALDRAERSVSVDGESIGVKIAAVDDNEVNRSVEWDDVIAAAAKLDLTAKQVLAAATAAATHLET